MNSAWPDTSNLFRDQERITVFFRDCGHVGVLKFQKYVPELIGKGPRSLPGAGSA
ncbi:MAG: hypothetical protein QOJ99_4691 [Bryobacterales bacterium]|nr:hypothetical protein [Bryobacterales bacterium]